MIIDDFLQLQSQQYSSNSQTMQEQSVKISIKVTRKVVGMNFGRFSRTLDGRYKALNPLQPRKGQVPLRTMLNQRFKIYFAASGVILWFLIGILELIWKNYSWMNLRLGKQCMVGVHDLLKERFRYFKNYLGKLITMIMTNSKGPQNMKQWFQLFAPLEWKWSQNANQVNPCLIF